MRPASDANRERIYSSLGNVVEGANVLDLFAGTGSYGLEGLSRGCSQATFVEESPIFSKIIEENYRKVMKSGALTDNACRVLCRDVLVFLKMKSDAPYQLIFLDPPYAIIEDILQPCLDLLLVNGYSEEKTLLIHEYPSGQMNDYSGWSVIRDLGKKRKVEVKAWRGKPSQVRFHSEKKRTRICREFCSKNRNRTFLGSG